MWQAPPSPHLYIFEHFPTFVWSNSHFVLPISDLTAFIWAETPIGGKVQKWSKASGHWAVGCCNNMYKCLGGVVQLSVDTRHAEKRVFKLWHNISDHIGWRRIELCCDVVCVREAPGLFGQSHSNPLYTQAGSSLSISNPDLIELYVSPDVSFDSWCAINVLVLAQLSKSTISYWPKTKLSVFFIFFASLSKQRVMELFGKFLISQLHFKTSKCLVGTKFGRGSLSGVGSEEGTGD